MWRAQVTVNGKRIGKTFRTKPEAQCWLRTTLGQIDHGYDVQGRKVTLGEYLQQWLDTSNSHLRSSTLYQYTLTIKNQILPHFGNIPLKDLSLVRVERHYSDLHKTGLSAQTIKLVHAVLHRALKKSHEI